MYFQRGLVLFAVHSQINEVSMENAVSLQEKTLKAYPPQLVPSYARPVPLNVVPGKETEGQAPSRAMDSLGLDPEMGRDSAILGRGMWCVHWGG